MLRLDKKVTLYPLFFEILSDETQLRTFYTKVDMLKIGNELFTDSTADQKHFDFT